MSVRRILVIEDDAAIRRAVVDSLKSDGYRPVGAGDGESGLQAADCDNFDLELLDSTFPGIGSPKVPSRRRESQPSAPLVTLPASAD